MKTLKDAEARFADRLASLPRIAYPDELPVSQRREEIADAIARHQVTVVCGETGSGKTTQLPKICLELGRGMAGMIGHTQPRRIAARAVADRLADELRVKGTSCVGTKIRFADRTTDRTLIKLMTDGILLAETQADRQLERYDTIIIDEAHERSLNIDFLLGYLRKLLPRRPDLKVVITSATIDPQRFRDHFAAVLDTPPPVIEVSGRTYPVETRYRPLVGSAGLDDVDLRMEDAIVDAVDELTRESTGDVLVFLPGERDIRVAAKDLGKWAATQREPSEVLPLFARLSSAEQQRVFKTGRSRRIVLATNVAETSLTVPGIRSVVDTGLARISRYTPRTRVQRLPIEAISQASANQRSGRCGRVGPGVCIRLYDESDFDRRDEFTAPEIVRTNLASVILQMAALNLGRIEDFPFIDPPDPRNVRDGYETLREIGALDEEDGLTEVGRNLATLPVDPRIGRIVLAGHEEDVLHEALVIAAALSVQDPRERPADKQVMADEAHEQFRHFESDFLTMLNLWQFYHHLKDTISGSQLRKAMRQNFLSYSRMIEWRDVYVQLKRLVADMGLRPKAIDPSFGTFESPRYAPIHRALLAGLLTSVGHRDQAERGPGSHEYKSTQGTRFSIHPGSGVFGKKPKWVVAGELVRTTKLYARMCARVEVEWIESAAGEMVKRSFFEPHWVADKGVAGAFEKVPLFGLELIARRPIAFGKVDAPAARAMFIHHGLVDRDWDTDLACIAHNDAMVQRVRQLEARKRQRDLLVEADAMHKFYDERLPKAVWSGQRLRRHLRKHGGADANLRMTEEDLIRKDADLADAARFPISMSIAGVDFALEYHLEHEHEADGVTLVATLDTLGVVDAQRTEWLVPGMVRDKIVELIRSLPKQYRRLFGPAPAWAAKFLEDHVFGEGDLVAELIEAVARESGVGVPREEWGVRGLPPHLRMNYRVLDATGEAVAEGRDLEEIKRSVGREVRGRLAGVESHPLIQSGLTGWSFGEIPKTVEITRNNVTLVGHPAIVDESSRTVGLRLMESPAAAAEANRAGLRRLCMLTLHDEFKYRAERLPHVDRLSLLYASVPNTSGGEHDLRTEIVTLIAERAFVAGRPIPRDEVEYERRLDQGYVRLGDGQVEVLKVVAGVLEEHQRSREALARVTAENAPEAWGRMARSVGEQLDGLVFSGFLTETPWEWLAHMPRYLRATQARMQKIRNVGHQRDAELEAQVARFWAGYSRAKELHDAHGVVDPALVDYRWMIEELRVSLFAQELKTAVKVSPQRLEKQWEKIVK